MAVLPPVYNGLDEAASDLANAAGRPGIGGKRDVLYSLSGGLESISRAVKQIARTLSEAGYGPEVCDPVSITATAIFTASTRAEEATHAVGSLMNMRIGDLPGSGRQVPHHTEISGGNAAAPAIRYDEYRTPGGSGHWGAGLVGCEVEDPADGQLIGHVEGTATLRYPGTPPADVAMVRHLHGDGQLRAYEQREVREHVAHGTIAGRLALNPNGGN